jgi:integrase
MWYPNLRLELFLPQSLLSFILIGVLLSNYPEKNQVTVKSSKNGKSRTMLVSQHLMGKLFSLPKKENLVFQKRAKGSRQLAFRSRMKTLARIHDNPRLKKIHYHTFRHCKALREYDKTLNMQRVKRILGHKSILTTQRYVELYEELYENTPRETVCEIALNIQEAKKLMEQGFKYETGEYNDGGKLFYKYK